MSIAPKPLIAHDFADLPALLAQAGRTDLVPAEVTASLLAASLPAASLPAADQAKRPVPAGFPDPPAHSCWLARPAPANAGDTAGGSELSALLAELEAANQTLAALLAQDEQERRSALEELERYDAARSALDQARHARARAFAVQSQAQQVVDSAFSPATQAAAGQVLETARGTAERADRLVSAHEGRVGALAARPEIERALQQRQRQEQAERRADALCTARTAIEAGWLEEARSALLPVSEAHPDDAEVAGLLDDIAREQRMARNGAAEAALWTARRELRRNPEAAVNRLSALEFDGLPRDLVNQIFGAWLHACARLCRERGAEQPVRYAPSRDCSAVLVRESPAGAYVVLSALGMDDRWRAGRRVRECVAKTAQPLLP